ncbi:hypothetical protein ACGFIE_12085 [Micromonospora sp. NPDC049275]|uniref:hypothetical protein n=1 Tax=Micromonospora sp. NPDC049275 TaxID=3364268 RepID=UPI0037146C7D
MTPQAALTNTGLMQRDRTPTVADDGDLRSHHTTNGQQHPDTAIVDALTAFLNREAEPSGADALELVSSLIDSSGRPLLAETWDVNAAVSEDRYGVPTATITAGPVTIAVTPVPGTAAPLSVAIATENGEYVSLDLTVNQHPVHHPAVLAPCPASTDPSGPNRAHDHQRTLR